MVLGKGVGNVPGVVRMRYWGREKEDMQHLVSTDDQLGEGYRS